MIYPFTVDSTLATIIVGSTVVYSIIVGVKLIGRLGTRVNRLLVLFVLTYVPFNVINVVTSILQNFGYPLDITTNLIIGGVMNITSTSILVYVMTIRNAVLMENRKVYVSAKVLAVLVIMSQTIYNIGNMAYPAPPNVWWGFETSFSVSNSMSMVVTCLLGLLDLVSNVYLLRYYYKYYFMSSSVMKYMRPQMEYRRNWTCFVICTDILAFVFLILNSLNIYPDTFASFGNLFEVFQVDIIVDFVKFDTIRNEITLGNDTIYMLEASKEENVDGDT